jgi:hypothetical protein
VVSFAADPMRARRARRPKFTSAYFCGSPGFGFFLHPHATGGFKQERRIAAGYVK